MFLVGTLLNMHSTKLLGLNWKIIKKIRLQPESEGIETLMKGPL